MMFECGRRNAERKKKKTEDGNSELGMRNAERKKDSGSRFQIWDSSDLGFRIWDFGLERHGKEMECIANG